MVFKRLLCCVTDPVVEPMLVPKHEPKLPAPVDLSQFTLKRVVGKGTYARVRVVERSAHQNSNLYALKQVEKSHCGLHNAKSVVNERKVLEEIVHHPFIIHLSWAFQDESSCYLVLNLMLGGDLRFHLVRRGSLGENSVRFYVAEISSALAYLHSKGICHRDVKPENVLLDLQGHVRLTDFNVAMRFSDKERYVEVAGTMVYMAPEMVARMGYSWQVDYWSLGILAYECLFFGQRPFADGCTNVETLKDAIVRLPLGFPVPYNNICSDEGYDAIAELLNRDHGKRLGCKGWSRRQGQVQLRGHSWFRDINWERLDTRRLSPPFLPDAAWNFEEDDEPAWVSEAQLRRHINRISHMSHMSEKSTAEQRYLEEHFTPYDMDRNQRPMFMGPPQNERIAAPHPARAKRRPRFSLKSGEEGRKLL